MTKGTILGDTFEQLAELGASSAKKTVKSVGQIANPFSSNESNESNKSNKSPEVNTKKNHTPVDFKKFTDNFENKDKLKAEALSRQFFHNVKREDEKILERKDMEEIQKKRQEEYKVQEQKRENQQTKQSRQQEGLPEGKAKRGVMSRKKTSEQQHVENKPSTGKQ